MKIFLILFVLQINSLFSCEYASIGVALQGDLENLAIKNCNFEYEKSTSCECSKIELDKFEVPKSNPDKSYKKVETLITKKIISLSQKIVTMGFNSELKNNTELTASGKECNINNLIPKECNGKPSKFLDDLFQKTKNEIINNFNSSPSKSEMLKNPSLSGIDYHKRKTCNLSDAMALEANYHLANKNFETLILSLKEKINEIPSQIKTLNDLNQYFHNQKSIETVKSSTEEESFIRTIKANPFMKDLLDSTEVFKNIVDNDFNINSLNKSGINDHILKALKKECEDTSTLITELYCKKKPIHPNQFVDLQNELWSQPAETNIEIADINSQIHQYCVTPETEIQESNKLLSEAQKGIPPELKTGTIGNFLNSRSHRIVDQSNHLCEEIKDLSPTQLAQKIKDKGCEEDVGQDCTYLKTFEVLLKGQISEIGAALDETAKTKEKSIQEILNLSNKKDNKMPNIVSAFIGREIEESISEDNVADTQVNSQEGSSTKLASGGSLNKISGAKKLGSRNYQNNTTNINNGGRTNQMAANGSGSSQGAPKYNVQENMNNLYDEINRRIQNGIDNEKAQASVNPAAKSKVGETLKKAMSGKIANYIPSPPPAYNPPPVDPNYSLADNGYSNFFDDETAEDNDKYIGNPYYDPSTTSVAGRNRALAAARSALRGPSSPQLYGGREPASIETDSYDTPTLLLDTNLDEVISVLSQGDFKDKDKIIDVLSDKNKKSFYIQDKNNQNFVVRVIKKIDGTFDVRRFGPTANNDPKYDSFYSSVQNTLSKKFDVNSLIDYLKGNIQEERNGPNANSLGRLFN